MTTTRLASLALVASLALGGVASAALIDDFDTPGLGEYSLAKVLDQGTATNVSFSDASGTLDATSTGADGAEQVLFFRNDVTLAVGDELLLDANFTTFNGNDLGLAVGENPVDLGDGNAGDNRALGDFLFVSLRSAGQLNSRGFNGGSEVGQVQVFGATIDQVFIARTGAGSIELGWYDGASRNVMRSETVSASIFDNIGFYADLRTDGAGFAGADNLRIIPEPAAAMLLVMGACGYAARRK